MRLLVVSDNRTSLNWGCRATSIALTELLARRFELTGAIYNDIKKRRLCASAPAWAQPGRGGRLRRAVAWRLDRFWGRHRDFVSLDAERSVRTLRRYKDRRAELGRIFHQVAEADAVVVNGEGDMIFNPQRRTLQFLLMIIELARQLDKRVCFVNAMVSDCPRVGRDADVAAACVRGLGACTLVTVRDRDSLRLLESLDGSIPARFVPDALFTWGPRVGPAAEAVALAGDAVLPYPHDKRFGDYDFSGPYVCVAGSSLAATLDPRKAQDAYGELLVALRSLGPPVYVMIACTGDSFLEKVAERVGAPIVPVQTPILLAGGVLSRCSLFVSGRYHPTVLASLGGAPCVCLDSNSHKMASVQEVLGYDAPRVFDALPGGDAVNEIMDAASAALAAGDALRSKIRSAADEAAAQAVGLNDLLMERLS